MHREHEYPHPGPALADLLHELEAVRAGQGDIDDSQVGDLLLHRGEGGARVRRFGTQG